MKILVNYADSNYKNAQKLNSWTGKHIAKFDKVYSFGPDDIDPDYREKHKEIFSYKRGNGLWLWKSYLISKVLEESNDGDYIFYVDSGAFFLNNVDNIIKSMRKDEEIWVSDCPLLESCFTKPECFELMDCNDDRYKNTNQIQATYILLKNCPEVRKFIAIWKRFCENHELLSPKGSLDISSNLGNGFVAHREDQSILSLLCKKHNIKPHRDPSHRGYMPETFYNEKYAFSVPNHTDDTYKSFAFLHKVGDTNLFSIMKVLIKHNLMRLKFAKRCANEKNI